MRVLYAAAASLPAACAVSMAQEEVPAIISHPTAQSRAELSRAVREMLENNNVMLADDALTTTSSLFIERTARRDAGGRQINGRELGRPDLFRLVKQGDDCILVHDNNDARRRLGAVSCEADKNGTN